LTKGIIGLVNKGQPRKPDDWGSLRAWGWGASRGLDYLETDKAVNAKQVGSREFHATARQPWSLWRLISASQSFLSVPPEKAAPNCTAAIW